MHRFQEYNAKSAGHFLDKNDKASAEWRLEGDLDAFENSIYAATMQQ
ncbi:MAG TPA: hypothetical protein PKV33_04025 [Methanothrix sp.]|nr:hypothetical protein [Methanothrix sp.]